MKDHFNKENLINFAIIALATAVGAVFLAPYVAKLKAKILPA